MKAHVNLAELNEARILEFDHIGSDEGMLVAIESGAIPFEIARTFHIWGVQAGKIRGRHAHRRCQQILFCVAGACRVVCRDGALESEFLLDGPDRGLFIPATLWSEQHYETAGTVLFVLADRRYEPDDYIRNWDTYLKFRGRR